MRSIRATFTYLSLSISGLIALGFILGGLYMVARAMQFITTAGGFFLMIVGLWGMLETVRQLLITWKYAHMPRHFWKQRAD
ncbi:hypothetical protein P7B02_09820 [Caulobacter segnis]|uniref:hypothetical protein n=1 Tax=Caulobacter segnis TaxID=88688 RepID=UPI0024104435|nr:hypothetical protein [Caulobacter segnis]MDG2521839.1 hypothetical protein [Caulobacter segnis]